MLLDELLADFIRSYHDTAQSTLSNLQLMNKFPWHSVERYLRTMRTQRISSGNIVLPYHHVISVFDSVSNFRGTFPFVSMRQPGG